MQPLPIPPTPPKAGVNWGQLVAILLLCVVCGLIGVTLPYARNASNTSDDIAFGNDLAGCKSAAGAALTDARNDVDDARDELADLQSRLNEAFVTGNVTVFNDLGPLFEPARRAHAEARRVRNEVNDAYQDAIDLSIEDPQEFLRQCRAKPSPTASSSTTSLHGAIGGAPPSTVALTSSTTTRGRTSATRPSTSTTGTTTTTTTFPSSPTTEPPICNTPLPVPVPLELLCL